MPQPTTMKDQIINVAIDLFSARGFNGTSIRDISAATGMSISNIYHYFVNKEGLLLAILQRSSRRLLDELRQVCGMDLEPLDRFEALLETHIHLCREFGKETKIFFLDEEHLSPEGNEINLQIQREVLAIYLGQLRELERLGYVHCRSLTVLAFNILGVINWHLRWYRPDGALSHDETSEQMISFILRGVLGTQAEQAIPESFD
ncbi:MAG: TetR/AcrR family transcriptional regulator [Desulfobacteraceae bacterium]|jgi:AcrR family transcriptional regulator